MFATISEAKFNEVMQPVWSAYKSAMHLARSTSSKLLGAMGFGNLWHRLKADRLLVLIRCLSSRNVYVKQVTRATLFLEAQWASTGNAVMETPHCEGRGWSGTWVGDLRIWMREQGLSLSGGPRLEILREGDAFLGDEESLQSKQVEVTIGLWALDIHRRSELYTSNGDRRVQLVDGSWVTQLRRNVAVSEPFCADDWSDTVQRWMLEWELGGGWMGRWTVSAVRQGHIVGWFEGADFRVGEVVRCDDIKCGWGGEVMVSRWVEYDGGSVRQWSQEMKARAWNREGPGQVWCRPDIERRSTVLKNAVWPMAVVTMACTEAEGDRHKVIWIDESEGVRERWRTFSLNEVGDRVTGAGVLESCESGDRSELGATGPEQRNWLVGKCGGSNEVEGEYYPGKEALVGYHHSNNHNEECFRWLYAEAKAVKEKGLDAVLLTYSDASFKQEGDGGKATYAWMVGGVKDGGMLPKHMTLSGGGLVHGHRSLLSSTRAEHVGVLSLLTALSEWPDLRDVFDGHEHRCDNKGVHDRMDHGSWGDDSAFTPEDWARFNDPDVHAESEAQREKVGLQSQILWHRGHPERRLVRDRWSVHDTAIFTVDALAEDQYAISGTVREDWWAFTHKPEYELRWRGKPLVGANMRKGLMRALQDEAWTDFFLQRWVRVAVDQEKEKRRAEGRGWEHGEQATYRRAQYNRLKAQVDAEGAGLWIRGTGCAGLAGRSLHDKITIVKLIAGMLRTAGAHAAARSGSNCGECRLCGKECDGGETNYHVLWQCKGAKVNEPHGPLVGDRVEMLDKLRVVLRKGGLEEEAQLVMSAMWELEDGGLLWGTAEQAMEEIGIMDEVVMRRWMLLREVERGMAGEGVKMARRGVLGAPWIQMLVSLGQTETDAKTLCAKVGAIVQKGCVQVWRAFCKQVHQGEDNNHGAFGEELQRVMDQGVLSAKQVHAVRKLDILQREVWHLKYMARISDGQEVNHAFGMALGAATCAAGSGERGMTMVEFQVQQRTQREMERRRAQSAADVAATPPQVSAVDYMMNLDRRRTVDKLRTVAGSSRKQRRKSRRHGGALRGDGSAPRAQPRSDPGSDAELGEGPDDGRWVRGDAPEGNEDAEGRLRRPRRRARRGLVNSDEDGTDTDGATNEHCGGAVSWLAHGVEQVSTILTGAPDSIEQLLFGTWDSIEVRAENRHGPTPNVGTAQQTSLATPTDPDLTRTAQQAREGLVRGRRLRRYSGTSVGDARRRQLVLGQRTSHEAQTRCTPDTGTDWHSGVSVEAGQVGEGGNVGCGQGMGRRSTRSRSCPRRGDGDGGECGAIFEADHDSGSVPRRAGGIASRGDMGMDGRGAGEERRQGAGAAGSAIGQRQGRGAYDTEVGLVCDGAVRVAQTSRVVTRTGAGNDGGRQGVVAAVAGSGGSGLGGNRHDNRVDAGPAHYENSVAAGEIELQGRRGLLQVPASGGTAATVRRGGRRGGTLAEGVVVGAGQGESEVAGCGGGEGAVIGHDNGGADCEGNRPGQAGGCGDRLDGWNTVVTGSSAEGGAVSAIRHAGTHVLGAWGMGNEYCSGLVARDGCATVGNGAGPDQAEVQVAGHGGQGPAGDVALLQDLLEGGFDQHKQGQPLQAERSRPPFSSTSRHYDSERQVGAQGRSDGEARHSSGRVLRYGAISHVLHGESCGWTATEALHEQLGAEVEGKGASYRGPLLCLSTPISQTDTLLDEFDHGSVAAAGYDRVGEVRGQVRGRQVVAGREVGARVQDRPGELASGGRQRQKSIQEHDTKDTTPGDTKGGRDGEGTSQGAVIFNGRRDASSQFWDTVSGLKKDPGKQV